MHSWMKVYEITKTEKSIFYMQISYTFFFSKLNSVSEPKLSSMFDYFSTALRFFLLVNISRKCPLQSSRPANLQ